MHLSLCSQMGRTSSELQPVMIFTLSRNAKQGAQKLQAPIRHSTGEFFVSSLLIMTCTSEQIALAKGRVSWSEILYVCNFGLETKVLRLLKNSAVDKVTLSSQLFTCKSQITREDVGSKKVNKSRETASVAGGFAKWRLFLWYQNQIMTSLVLHIAKELWYIFVHFCDWVLFNHENESLLEIS